MQVLWILAVAAQARPLTPPPPTVATVVHPHQSSLHSSYYSPHGHSRLLLPTFSLLRMASQAQLMISVPIGGPLRVQRFFTPFEQPQQRVVFALAAWLPAREGSSAVTYWRSYR